MEKDRAGRTCPVPATYFLTWAPAAVVAGFALAAGAAVTAGFTAPFELMFARMSVEKPDRCISLNEDGEVIDPSRATQVEVLVDALAEVGGSRMGALAPSCVQPAETHFWSFPKKPRCPLWIPQRAAAARPPRPRGRR